MIPMAVEGQDDAKKAQKASPDAQGEVLNIPKCQLVNLAHLWAQLSDCMRAHSLSQSQPLGVGDTAAERKRPEKKKHFASSDPHPSSLKYLAF